MARETTLQVRCSIAEKEAWRLLAESKGADLSEYVRSLLNLLVEQRMNGGANG